MTARHSPPPSAAAAGPSELTTRLALLDTAERLFAQNGFEGTSVREIIGAAGVNLGAINYHFGTKERLAIEVFARRLEPVNRNRIARLDALEAAAGNRKVPIEAIIDALIRPAVEAKDLGEAGCDDLLRLMSRCFQEPNPELKKFVEQQFADVVGRFDSAILRALPGLSPDDLFWRMNFLFGSLHHGLGTWLRFDVMPHPGGAVAARPDREGFIQRVISFVVAGLSTKPSRIKLSKRSNSRRPTRRRQSK